MPDDVKIKIEAELAEASRKLQQLAKEVSGLGTAAEGASSRSKSAFSNFQSTAQNALGKVSGSVFTLKNTLLGLAGVGSFTALLAKATSEAANQQEVFGRLEGALDNIGVNYDAVSGSLDSLIRKTQQATQFGDTEQAQVLTKLTILTGDYDKSIQALDETLDVATGLTIDHQTAAKLVGQALAGNLAMIGRYVPALRGVSTEEFKAMTEAEQLELVLGTLEKTFGGLAEQAGGTFKGQIIQAKTAFGDLLESAGDFVIFSPAVTGAIDKIEHKLLDWSDALASARAHQGLNTQAVADGNQAIDKLSKGFGLGQIEALGWTDKIAGARETTATMNAVVSDSIAFLEGMTKGLVVAGRTGQAFGGIMSGAFHLIEVQVDWAKTAVGGLLEGVLKLVRFAATSSVGDKLLGFAGIAPSPQELQDINNLITLFGQFRKGSLEDTKNSLAELKGSVRDIGSAFGAIPGDLKKVDQIFGELRKKGDSLVTSLSAVPPIVEEAGEETEKAGGKAEKAETKVEQLIEAVQKHIEETEHQIAALLSSKEALIDYESAILLANGATEEQIEKFKELRELSDVYDLLLEKAKDYVAVVGQMQTLSVAPGVSFPVFGSLEGFPEAVEESFDEADERVKESFDVWEEFAADTFGAIRSGVGDLIDNVLAGKFDSLGDIADATFATIRRSIADLISYALLNPIVLNITPGGGFGGGFNLSSLAQPFTGLSNFVTNAPIPAMANLGIPPPATWLGVNPLLFGAPFLGAGLGLLSGGVPGLITGGLGGLGALGGGIGGAALGSAIGGTLGSIVPGLGTVIGGLLGSILGDLIGDLFKDTPRLDIEPLGIGNEDEWAKAVEEGLTVTVQDFLDAATDEALKNSLIWIKGKGGAEDSDMDLIRDSIVDVIGATIEGIESVLAKLPADLSAKLTKALHKTTIKLVDIPGDEFGLEFDEQGEDIQEEVEKFFKELPSRVTASIPDFFVTAFTAFGADVENAKEYVKEQLDKFSSLGDEERTKWGEEFLANFEAYVDAFNIVNAEFNDAISSGIGRISALAEELGFKDMPTITAIKDTIKKLIKEMDIDPKTVAKFAELRVLIIQIQIALAQAIGNAVAQIDNLNAKIKMLGGSSISTGNALQKAQNALLKFSQQEGLSLEEKQQLLAQLESLVDQQLQKMLEKAQKKLQKQQENIQEDISNLQKKKQLIEETKRAEIEGLERALEISRRFADINASLKDDLKNLFVGPGSILNPIEQVNFIQGEIIKIESALKAAKTPEARLEAIAALQALQAELIDLGASAFPTASPEFQAIFRQVADRLQQLVDSTQGQANKAVTLEAQIDSLNKKLAQKLEKIDETIAKKQDKLTELQNTEITLSGKQAERLRGILEYIRNEQEKFLKDSLKNLGAINASSNDLAKLSYDKQKEQHDTEKEQLGEQKKISEQIKKLQQTIQQAYKIPTIHAQHGFEGIVTRPTYFLAGEPQAGPEHVSIKPLRHGPGGGKLELTIRLIAEGPAAEPTRRMLINEAQRDILDFIKYGKAKEAIVEIMKSNAHP